MATLEYIDLIGEILQKGQVRSTSKLRACMIRCMNVDVARGVCKDRSRWLFCSFCQRCEFMYVCRLISEALLSSYKLNGSYIGGQIIISDISVHNLLVCRLATLLQLVIHSRKKMIKLT